MNKILAVQVHMVGTTSYESIHNVEKVYTNAGDSYCVWAHEFDKMCEYRFPLRNINFIKEIYGKEEE